MRPIMPLSFSYCITCTMTYYDYVLIRYILYITIYTYSP